MWFSLSHDRDADEPSVNGGSPPEGQEVLECPMEAPARRDQEAGLGVVLERLARYYAFRELKR